MESSKPIRPAPSATANRAGPNPTLVQPLPPAKRANPPTRVILIHDGGGTVFSYFTLGNLRREVRAVSNPRFHDGSAWEGGMDEMARHYIDLLRQDGVQGRIILGGWSLGGLLSVTMARMLADDPSAGIVVAGLLLIDSPYHIARATITTETTPLTLEGIPELVQKAFDNCDIMLQHWDLPSWEAPACGGDAVAFRVGGRPYTVQPDEILYKPFKGDWSHMKTTRYTKYPSGADSSTAAALPPGVMIRCAQPMKETQESQHPCRIDIFRNDTLLGWDGRYPDFIKACIDVDANHYDVFKWQNTEKIEDLTAQINAALQVLDTLYRKK